MSRTRNGRGGPGSYSLRYADTHIQSKCKLYYHKNDIEINEGSKEAVFLVCSIILTLLTFILMIEIINSILNEIGVSVGKWLGQEINWMTLESLTFVIFVPCAWLMGIPYEEVTIAANVLAKKGFDKTVSY